jgi:hypothetical protein
MNPWMQPLINPLTAAAAGASGATSSGTAPPATVNAMVCMYSLSKYPSAALLSSIGKQLLL